MTVKAMEVVVFSQTLEVSIPRELLLILTNKMNGIIKNFVMINKMHHQEDMKVAQKKEVMKTMSQILP